MQSIVDKLKGIINSLELNESIFCNGSYPLKEPIKLFFSKNKDDNIAHSICLPNITECDLKVLIESCSKASFGRDNQNVLDDSYRRALKIIPFNYL